MNKPSTAELLLEKTREEVRLQALLLANECEALDEFRQRWQEMIEQ